MGQQSLIYSFVARGTVILAEYTEFTGNFTGVAAQCLQKLPSTNNKFTYNCDGHTFNYLVDDGFTYCVVAVESLGRQLPNAFLERVKEDFTKKYDGGKAATAVANGLKKEFGPKLKEHMQYCVDHPEEVSKLAKVKAQVSEVKGVMMENIEKVLDRGEKIELLVDKTENLRSQFCVFKSLASQRLAPMFTNHQRQEEQTGRYGTPRLQYLQELVSQFQNTTDEATKEKIVANLSNFAYDPYNYTFLRQLNVLELFLDCITEPNEKLVEFGIGGICNACVDPANAAIITRCDGIPLVVQCLSSPVRNTVNHALGALYYLCSKSTKEEILNPKVVDVIRRYAAAESVSFSNLAEAFLDEHVVGNK